MAAPSLPAVLFSPFSPLIFFSNYQANQTHQNQDCIRIIVFRKFVKNVKKIFYIHIENRRVFKDSKPVQCYLPYYFWSNQRIRYSLQRARYIGELQILYFVDQKNFFLAGTPRYIERWLKSYLFTFFHMLISDQEGQSILTEKVYFKAKIDIFPIFILINFLEQTL